MAFLHYFTRCLKYLEKKAVFLGTSYFLRQFLFFFLIDKNPWLVVKIKITFTYTYFRTNLLYM